MLTNDINHYTWLDVHLDPFMRRLGIAKHCYCGIITAHGDKCSGYRYSWEKAGIPYAHGVAIFFLTYLKPYDKESRNTVIGWINPKDWVINNYPRFKDFLDPINEHCGESIKEI